MEGFLLYTLLPLLTPPLPLPPMLCPLQVPVLFLLLLLPISSLQWLSVNKSGEQTSYLDLKPETVVDLEAF
jgi:hypothetical protein